MSQLLLEKNLESKFLPKTVKENTIQELADNPDELGKILAEELLSKVKFALLK